MNRRKSFVLTSALMFFSVVCALVGIVLLIFIFFKNQTSAVADAEIDESKYCDVLYISSYDPRYLVTKNQLEGIEDSMQKFNIMYEVMYMDMLNYDTRENFELFYQTLKHKISMRGTKYKALIVSDDAALTFIERYHDELFEGIPVVFFGVNNIEHAKQVQKYPWITGFGERIFVEDTIEVMVEQNVNLNKIYCILDDSLTGRGDKAQFVLAMKKYPNLG